MDTSRTRDTVDIDVRSVDAAAAGGGRVVVVTDDGRDVEDDMAKGRGLGYTDKAWRRASTTVSSDDGPA